MKKPNRLAESSVLFLSAVFFLWGCMEVASLADQGIRKLPVETLWASNQSDYDSSKPVAMWVGDSERLHSLVQKNPERAGATIGLHRMDWSREGVLWLYMGLKTTGGYALSLAATEAAVSNGIAVIRVLWREPRPGAIVTQQLTSPCLVLKLPKSNYSEIEIRDDTDSVRARVAIGRGN